MIKDTFYVAYSLAYFNKKKSKEDAIEEILYMFKQRFHVVPEEYYVGPVQNEFGQVVVPDNTVFIPLPKKGDKVFSGEYKKTKAKERLNSGKTS